MRRLLKFLHTMGAIGLMGAMASLLVLMAVAPPPSSLAGYALIHAAMADIATFVFFPSLALTLVAGLLAIAVNRAFHEAGWAWAKLATGVLMFEGCLVYIQGPLQEEAARSASALAGQLDPATLTGSYGAERGSIWVLLAVATANVALGVWRPRFTKARPKAPAAPSLSPTSYLMADRRSRRVGEAPAPGAGAGARASEAAHAEPSATK